jgi:histidinol-phosphate aminotransferase
MEQVVSDQRPLIAPRDEVASMEGYFSPQLDVSVRLNTNEAPEPPPPEFVAELLREINEVALNRYPDRVAVELRRAIGELHGVDIDRVYAANGSNEVIQSVLLAYGGPGRTAVVFEPTYALHSHIPRITGTKVLAGARDKDYLVSADEVDRVLAEAASTDPSAPAVVFLCSPNNPTGRVERLDLVEHVLDLAPGLVIVDEAYGQFAPRSAVELASAHRNLVVVRTFSKTWSLAALRLGYAIADPEVVDALFSVSLPYHLDALKQAAGRIALEYVDDMHDRVERLVEERERLLVSLGSRLVEVVPSQANFILFRVPGQSAHDVWTTLVEHSVIVRDLTTYADLEGFLRVTVGTPLENDAFLAALDVVLAEV